MREHDLSAKYLVLPPTIDSKDIVIEVNTKLTEAEHCGEPFDDSRALNSSARHPWGSWLAGPRGKSVVSGVFAWLGWQFLDCIQGSFDGFTGARTKFELRAATRFAFAR